MSRTSSTYGISRVDNEVSRTHGWLVTIQRRGVIHRRHFSDGTHGGKQKSFSAAKAYRDEIMAKYPPFSMREYSNIVKKSNRSGVVGVCRYCASETRDLPEDEQRWFWVASWPLPSGQRKRVKFAVNKYGEDGAFKMALKARREAMKQLEGAFDPGAVRRRPRRAAKKPEAASVSAKPAAKVGVAPKARAVTKAAGSAKAGAKTNGSKHAPSSSKPNGTTKPNGTAKRSTKSTGKAVAAKAVSVPAASQRAAARRSV